VFFFLILFIYLFFIFVVAFRFALCKWLHFICRSLTATSSPQRSLVFQRFVSTVQGLSGDSTKDSSAKVINRKCQSLAVSGKMTSFIVASCGLMIIYYYVITHAITFLIWQVIWDICGWLSHCGLMVSALDHESSGPSSWPGRGHYVVFLG